MSTNVKIILVHGYTGSCRDLAPLAKILQNKYSPQALFEVSLPNHETPAPEFNEDFFCETIAAAYIKATSHNGRTVLVGHSTGGTLVMAALINKKIPLPDLLILASVPKRVTPESLNRWETHRQGRAAVSFSSVAQMVSLVNATGNKAHVVDCPVLVVHGEDDALVPSAEAAAWVHGLALARKVVIPGATHDIFQCKNNDLLIDIIVRAVADLVKQDVVDNETLQALCNIEPEAKSFLAKSPHGACHLANCPSSKNLVEKKIPLAPQALTEPVFANIEITTRCNLQCRHCARTQLKPGNSDIPLNRFEKILDSLPHAYRITLVGLGEPLLHPRIAEIVALAVNRGRRVGLVTNGMLLDKKMSETLIEAGLHSIAFSIDAGEKQLADELRHGSDLDRIAANIKTFVALAESSGRLLYTAVFSAISVKNAPHLQGLIAFVKDLGVKVLMLSDLNFSKNIDHTLWKNITEETETLIRKAILKGFAAKLPILSVHGLEEFGLAEQYEKFLLIPPSSLYQRSARRTWCASPWQTAPVDVNGNVTLCDCQPQTRIGNLLEQPFDDIWNGPVISSYREQMLGSTPPPPCKICPRF